MQNETAIGNADGRDAELRRVLGEEASPGYSDLHDETARPERGDNNGDNK